MGDYCCGGGYINPYNRWETTVVVGGILTHTRLGRWETTVIMVVASWRELGLLLYSYKINGCNYGAC